MPHPMALDRISPEWFKRGSQNLHLLGTVSPTNLPDMTSLNTSGRLQYAIKYCTKVCKAGAAGRVE